MQNRWTPAVVVLVVVGAGTLLAQSHPEVADAGKTWTQKTPWGDPDLSGAWTSDDMRGIPRERPAEQGTRRYLTDEEFAKRRSDDDQGRSREANRSGGFRNDTGTRTFRQTSLVIDPPDGRIPAFTPNAEARRASRDRGSFGEGPFERTEDFTLYDRCITRGVIGSILPVVYGNGNRISQSAGYVTITYEMIHDTRVIPVDGRPHLSPKIRQYLGDARGRFEGSTLVVETTNFTGRTRFQNSTDALRVVERFTRNGDGGIDYRFTVEDPNTWTRPWSAELPMMKVESRIFEYACHEGNHDLENILRVARSQERDAAAAARK